MVLDFLAGGIATMDKLTWKRHVIAFKDSKLSARAYTKQHELVYHQFLYRLRQFSPSQGARSNFVPVTLASKPVTENCLGVIEFPTGVRLIIHSPELVAMLPQWFLGRP